MICIVEKVQNSKEVHMNSKAYFEGMGKLTSRGEGESKIQGQYYQRVLYKHHAFFEGVGNVSPQAGGW